METTIKTVLAAIVTSVLVSGGAVYLLEERKSDEARIKDFYATETAVHVSPHGLRKKMDKGDDSFILVDLRSREEYEMAHIVGAVSIPAYADPDHSAYDEIDRIVSAFQDLGENKTVIVYCYSLACMTGRKIGNMLAEHGIYVEHLGIGWNEWRYDWDMWNHDGETPVRSLDYIVSGPDPGMPTVRELPSPCGEGDFSC
jgi:rhodanese-related sulfurtransferase